MYLADYHTHSYLSPDGIEPLDAMVDAAQKAGLSELCVTDHCDTVDWHNLSAVDSSAVIHSILADREYYLSTHSPNIKIKAGIELGEAHLHPELARACAQISGLDFIIGSVHILRDEGDFYNIQYSSNEQCYDLFNKYLDQNLEIAKQDFFDVLGHLGYCSRYMINSGCDARLDLCHFRDKITLLLNLIISNGKGIELNTSGLRSDIGFFPDEEILRLYKSLGGEIITMGSDAHTAKDIGNNLDTAAEFLKTIGFRYFTVFTKRKPTFIKL